MTKLIIILLVALFFETVGVILLSKGLRELPPPENYTPRELAGVVRRAATSKTVVAGVACEALFFIGLLMMMSRADVSFVWPLTSLTFVFSTLAAKYYLHEHVTPLRWAGVVLIMFGAGLITYSEKVRERTQRENPES